MHYLKIQKPYVLKFRIFYLKVPKKEKEKKEGGGDAKVNQYANSYKFWLKHVSK